MPLESQRMPLRGLYPYETSEPQQYQGEVILAARYAQDER